MGKWLAKRWENLKFDVAVFLNRNPDYCWSSLVRWAMSDKWYEIWTWNCAYRHKLCTPDNAYCLKCRYQWQRKHSYKQYGDYVHDLWERGRDVKCPTGLTKR